MKKLLVVLLVLGFVAPAMAAEWNWYGSARAYLGWTHSSSKNDSFGKWDRSPADTKWTNGLQGGHVVTGTSAGGFAIGARVKATDEISGLFEIGHYTTPDGVSEQAKFRRLMGMWNFGAGTLKVGHNDTILNTFPALPVHVDDDPWVANGVFFEGRQDQITLEFGGFQVSAVKNMATNYVEGVKKAKKEDPNLELYTVKSVVPKLEAAYTWKADAFLIKGGVGFQTFDLRHYDNMGVKDWDDDVTSWLFLLHTSYRPGPWFVSLGGWYGINAKAYGMAGANHTFNGLSYCDGWQNGDKYEDSEMYSIYLMGGIDINEMVGLGAGVSYMYSENDHDVRDWKDDVWNWYFQVPLTLTKGVRIIPEVGGHYFGKNKENGVDTKQGDWHYFSTKFIIDF